MRVQKVATISICAAVVALSPATWAEQKKSEEFFRQNSGAPAQFAQNSANQEDVLTRALREKQAALDAQQSATRTVSAQPPVTSQVDEKLIQALRQKQAELDAQGNVAFAAPRPVTSPSDEKLIKELRQKQAELDAQEAMSAAQTKKTLAQEQAEAKERAESQKRIQKIEDEIKAKNDAIQKKIAAQSNPAPIVTAPKTKTQVVQAAPAPAPVLSSKEARLADLLRKYKADEITPHEYHAERAKIVSEP